MSISYRQKRKAEVYKLLGDSCKRCGERDVRVLQIDHVYSDGSKERKLSRTALYRKVEENPKRYQLLCANDNWRKRDEDFKTQRRPKSLRRLLPRVILSIILLAIVVLWKISQ